MNSPFAYRSGRVTIARGDARQLPLGDSTVDLVVTSPPFWQLRSYTDGGTHYAGQLGSEPTLTAFLDNLWEVTAECARVLKPSGSLFVELGDSYTNKCLNDAPHRYVIGCVDKLGLIKRAEIPWHHVNGLPESVTDRVRRAHSMVFHLVKQPRYYAAVDEIREPHADPRTGRNGGARDFHTEQLSRKWNPSENAYNPLGKLPGSVWDIPSQPLTVPARLGIDHFAAFPMELPRRIILGWSPPGVCVACGEGRRPVAERASARPHKGTQPGRTRLSPDARHHLGRSTLDIVPDYRITGYACACPEPTAPTTPALVVDPFGGTGTTALVAAMHGRTGISVDRSADYCRLAVWRTRDPAERARAMQVPKPPPVPDGMEPLFT